MEIFVICDKTDGSIISSGKINRKWDADNLDGSTVTEFIGRSLAKDKNRVVVYLPDQNLPDKDKYKIEDKEIVELKK